MKRFISLVMTLVMLLCLGTGYTASAYEGEIADIEFIPHNPFVFYEQTNGEWRSDSGHNEYFHYYGICSRSSGDQLIIIDKQGHRYTYEAVFDEYDHEFHLICNENNDNFLYFDVQMIDEQDQKHFTLGGENYFYIEYKGIRKSIPVEIITNPVEWIEFYPATPCVLYENTNGHWDVNGEGQQFFNYDNPGFNDGDILMVKFKNQENATQFTYGVIDNCRDFYDEDGNTLPDRESLHTWKHTEGWGLGDNNPYYVQYSGRDSLVNVSIVTNPVKGIDYIRNVSDTFIEGDTEYDPWDDNYYYRIPYFQEGEILSVITDDGSVNYICKRNHENNELYFESEYGDIINENDVHIFSDQRNYPWVIGDKNEYQIEYMGYSKIIYTKVVQNNVKSIDYIRTTPSVYYEGTHGHFDEYDNAFRYDIPYFEVGDKLIVTYSDNSTSTYTYTFNDSTYEGEFKSNDGKVITNSELRFSDNQHDSPWGIGDQNEYSIVYSGRSCNLYVTITENPIDSIEYTRNQPAIIFENTDGWMDNDIWIYNNPGFCEGDTLVIKNKDKTSKTYTFRHIPDIHISEFISEDGDILSDVRSYSDQHQKHWTVDDDNYYYIEYNGFRTQPLKVTIQTNTTKEIRIEKANPCVIFEGDCHEEYSPITGQKYLAYDPPHFEDGDKLIIVDNDNTEKEYIYTFNEEDREHYFICGNESIPERDINVFSEQELYPWSTDGDHNYYIVEYRGKTFTIPVTIITSTVQRIVYNPINPERLIINEYDENSGSMIHEFGREYFSYFIPFSEPGDKLIITYKDGTSDSFTLYIPPNEEPPYFANSNGVRLDNSYIDIFDRQYDDPFSPDKNNCYYVKYQDCVCEVPVTVNHVYEDTIIPPSCTNEGYTEHKCIACGHTTKDSYKAKLNHSWDSGKITKAATYTSTGTKTFTCKHCKSTKSQVIAKLPKKINPLKVKAKTVTLKLSLLKNKKQKITKKKAFTISNV
ncbi:MAG: hypothetical protein IKN54_09330, partial [Lachnospiraceae bacterium]|nr:hypothetical protein [Lachnospiraceae bacterium]